MRLASRGPSRVGRVTWVWEESPPRLTSLLSARPFTRGLTFAEQKGRGRSTQPGVCRLASTLTVREVQGIKMRDTKKDVHGLQGNIQRQRAS